MGGQSMPGERLLKDTLTSGGGWTMAVTALLGVCWAPLRDRHQGATPRPLSHRLALGFAD